jgi:hypothetical protein
VKKIVNAFAALALVAGTVLVWSAPAQAAPGGACSVEEWSNPGLWSDCAKRLGSAVDDKTGCVTAPDPDSPTAGMAGWFTSRPDSSLRDGIQGPYTRYGVGGYGLDTYDLGCLSSIKSPDLTGSTMVANWEFQGAASIMAAANGLRERAYNPGTMWSWSDGFLEDVTHATYKYVFHPVGGLVFVMVGVFLIYRARHGQMSQAMSVTVWAIMVLVMVTAVAMGPVDAAHGFDTAGTKSLAVVHGVLGPAKQDAPAGMCPLGEQEACKDNRDAATRASDIAVETILYKPWLRAVLGDSESATAKKFGPALYDATAMEWGEAARAAQSPALREQLIEMKAQRWNAIAAQLRDPNSPDYDPIAYEYLQGRHASDRIGAGTIAFVSAGTFSIFDMAASVVVLFSFGIFRIAILLLPLLGTIAIFKYTSAGFRRIGHMAIAAIFNIIIFGAYAGIYLKAVGLVFDSDMPGWLKIVVIGLIGVAAFLILRPFRHLVHTATGRARKESSVVARGMTAAKTIRADNETERQAVDAAITEAAARGEVPVRPENNRMGSSARTAARAAAPTLTTAPDSPTWRALSDAASNPTNRPEGNRVDSASTLVGAVVNAVGDAHAPTPAPRPEK